jgi:Tol biopolymer transport system component
MLTLGGIVGCAPVATVEPVQEPQVAVEPPPPPPREPRPELAAARDAQFNEFGELPNVDDVPYFTRMSTSLLQHTHAEEGADFDASISPDGNWLIFASTRHNVAPDIYYKTVDGVAVTQLTADPAADVQPVYSPDRTKVAFASNRAGNWDIYVIGLEGQRPIQITTGPGDEVHPSWSPDGTRLAYCSLPSRGQWELWVTDARVGGKKRFIGYGLFPEWSPTANTIAYQRARERGGRWFSIWTVELVGDEPRYPTEVAASADAALISPTWSRDGSKLAYTAVVPSNGGSPDRPLETEQADVWIVDADGRSQLRLTDGHTSNFGPAWSVDGRVYFTSSREGKETIWSLLPLSPETTPIDVATVNEKVAPGGARPAGG